MGRRLLFQAVAFATALFMAARAAADAPPFPGLVTTTIASTDDAAVVPDDSALLSTLVISGVAGRIADVDVTLNVTHTQSDQLDISLVAPSGMTITLSTDNGGGNDNVFSPVTFDDQATGTPSAANVRNFTYVDLTSVGRIQPEEALGALVGEDPNGLWALVVVDDQGGQTGMLRSWSLTISTLPSFTPSPPVAFQGGGANLPNGNLTGFSSPVTVTGLGPRVLDVNVAVDITETNAADIDLFLTSPSGRRVDLVTDIGGGQDNLYVGTVFDDQGGTPIADMTLPPDLTAFTTVVPEGALSAFLGEDPNGTWTLTAVDDTGGNASRLNGWTLALSASSCGDGHLDTGEACDDGNSVAGDGCEPTCSVTVPGGGGGGGGCQGCTGAEDCSNCVDDDANGLVDGLDPACAPTGFQLTGVAVSFPRGLSRSGLKVTGDLRVPDGAAGSASVALADANGAIACVALGPLQSGPRRALVARSGQGNVKVRADGHLVMRGVGLDMSLLDDASLSVGVTVGNASFSSAGTLRPRGRSKRVYP